ncbi:MAG TPA: MmgE/PrpD family protein, partial [Xanthobacteraceae bacterium]|nr:MmgE/PrpD family protein [Xanthobacteraceae bacterium]
MDRRSFFRITAAAAAGLALSPRRAFAQASAPDSTMSVLSVYMSGAGTRPLPDEVVEQAKNHLLDSLASMISGSELPAGEAAQRYVRAHGGKGSATIAGTALTATSADAALANGMM